MCDQHSWSNSWNGDIVQKGRDHGHEGVAGCFGAFQVRA